MGGCLGFLSGATGRPAETFDSIPRGAAPPSRGEDFESYRAKANKAADNRRNLSAQSQAAWKAGRKSEAHSLSVKSKEQGAKVAEYNALAVKAILDPQNSESTGIIDLHGLFVREAENAVRDFLRQARDLGVRSEVRIITGRGMHSAHHIAKVKPAVIALLRESGHSFRPVPGNEGAFLVEVGSGGETPV